MNKHDTQFAENIHADVKAIHPFTEVPSFW